MNNDQAREVFNQAIASTTDADAIARIEVAREYFTNPEFRKSLEDLVWEATRWSPESARRRVGGTFGS